MNWENADVDFEEEKEASQDNTNNQSAQSANLMAFQLSRYQNPSNDSQRQSYISLITEFGIRLVSQQIHKLAEELLTEDSECFLTNFLNGKPVRYSIGNKDFLNLFKGYQIIERNVRETHVDLAKNVAFQISEWTIYSEETTLSSQQAVLEIFTIKDLRILRYRASFATKTEAHGSGDVFEPTRKDIMLAKVKEINYAVADQPDLEKITSLLHENTEYKIWSWEDQAYRTFHKHDFVEGFRSLEQNYKLKCIVPYEIYSEREYIIGTYAYHMEDVSIEPGRKCVWLSTCIYSFDKDINISMVSQQGELYAEDEVMAPFEVFTREKIEEIVRGIQGRWPSVELFCSHKIHFDCAVSRFGPLRSPNIGSFRGFKEIEKLNINLNVTTLKFEWSKLVDIFIDHHDPSYEVALALVCSQGKIERPNYEYQDQYINFYNVAQYSFENGQLAKLHQFFCEIPESIPSLFDDDNFEAINVRARNKGTKQFYVQKILYCP